MVVVVVEAMGKRIKYCAWPRCANKVVTKDSESVSGRSVFCEYHKKIRKANFARRDATDSNNSNNSSNSNRGRRPGAYSRGYDSAWIKLSKAYMASKNYICEFCGERAEEVDHIIPLSMGGERLSVSNVQALCRECHRRKHLAKTGGA